MSYDEECEADAPPRDNMMVEKIRHMLKEAQESARSRLRTAAKDYDRVARHREQCSMDLAWINKAVEALEPENKAAETTERDW